MITSFDDVKLIKVISDLHVGSSQGLMPREFSCFDGNVIKPNVYQNFLINCWEQHYKDVEKIKNGDDYITIINGDLVEGIHHKSKEVISAEIGDHIEAAIKVLRREMLESRQVFIINGTECHTGNSENAIGKALGTYQYDNGRYSTDKLNIMINGLVHTFHHHISISAKKWSESSGLCSTLNNERIECIANSETPPSVICCAHRHRFGEWNDGSGVCVVTPPWQMKTRFANKVVPSARTQPGFIMLDYRNAVKGELPHVRKRLYKMV